MNSIGRLFISGYFILLGILDILYWNDSLGRLSAKVPSANILLICFIILCIFGGIILATGHKAHLGAFALMVYLIPTTFIYHNFWAAAQADYQTQLLLFLKNLAILGGLLIVLSQEPKKKF